jgi:hypothetical protein
MSDGSERVFTLGDNVLLLGFGDGYEALASRLESLGFLTSRAESLEDALGALQLADSPIRALLLPPEPPVPDLANSLRWLSERSLDGLRAVVAGARATPDQIEQLRGAGVNLALWEPFTDGELRFVVNFLLYNPRRGEARFELRVPTPLVARILEDAASKEAPVHNLSASGAYLETTQPSEEGHQLEIELPLPSGALRLQAEVLSSQGADPWQKESVPKGISVRFLDLDPTTFELLESYVATRARTFQL